MRLESLNRVSRQIWVVAALSFAACPLSDYVSMVGLTDVDLDGDWGDEPTILRLFAASGDAAPQRMSIWDRAFLKALYETSQVDRHQRTEIARHMVRDFMGR